MKVYVPCDSAALSMGADEVAAAIARSRPDVEIVRNGSRGMFWLEPLVEVETAQGRFGYGPVFPENVDEFLAKGMLETRDAGTASL